MKRTIELDEQGERLLHRWAVAIGASSDDDALTELTSVVLQSEPLLARVLAHEDLAPARIVSRFAQWALASENFRPVRSTPEVMGGDHCIRNTRIPVWLLVSYKRQGMTDSDLLASYPALNSADLISAWDFYASNSDIVESERQRHQGAE